MKLSHKVNTILINYGFKFHTIPNIIFCVTFKLGASRKLELQIRLFYRRVLLDHWVHQSDIAFWLTRILKPWPMVNQARLLYLLYGPMSINDGKSRFRTRFSLHVLKKKKSSSLLFFDII